MSFNLRRLIDSTIIETLDTCRLTKLHFTSSTSLADNGLGYIPIPFPDSFFISFDVERGNPADSFDLARTDVYDQDNIFDVLPGDPPPDTAAYKQTHPTTEQPHAELTLHVYPNPATKSTRVCVEELTEGLPAIIEVVSEQGDRVAVLYNDTPSGDLGFCVNFDCSQLLSGTYYVRVYNSIEGKAAKLSVIR